MVPRLRVLVDQQGEPLRFSISYTLAKAMDMLNHVSVPEDSSDALLDKAPQNTDQRHNVVIASTWFLPGHGPTLSGWRLSGIAQFSQWTAVHDQLRRRPVGHDPGRRPAPVAGTPRAGTGTPMSISPSRGSSSWEAAARGSRGRLQCVSNTPTTVRPVYVGVIGSPNFGEPTGGLLGCVPRPAIPNWKYSLRF
jgi:hypothetical protein